jgi:hypothetical protein
MNFKRCENTLPILKKNNKRNILIKYTNKNKKETSKPLKTCKQNMFDKHKELLINKPAKTKPNWLVELNAIIFFILSSNNAVILPTKTEPKTTQKNNPLNKNDTSPANEFNAYMKM